MYLNLGAREINIKVVYYGPALSGKTTNIEQIYSRVDPSRRSELVSLKTNEDRTLFFDFFQLELGKINGLTPKIYLYTVPGQTYYEASRKIVLRGADGVVFVADSASDRLADNQAMLAKMYEQLEELGLPLDLPVVVQFNKQDLPNALSPDILNAALKLDDYPWIPAAAVNGKGVLETFRVILQLVVQQIQKQTA